MHSQEKPCPNESQTLDLGDCIGMESCVDLKGDLNMEGCVVTTSNKQEDDHLLHQWCVKKLEKKNGKEYPPPMPHMPWVMKRHYTGDGRLIITEEKLDRHQYFQAHRSNGRLTLRLVPLYDAVFLDDDDDDNYDAEEYGVDDDDDREEVKMDGFDDGCGVGVGEDRTVEDESKTNLLEFGGLSKCYKYDTAGSSPSMFSLTIAAITPLHT